MRLIRTHVNGFSELGPRLYYIGSRAEKCPCGFLLGQLIWQFSENKITASFEIMCYPPSLFGQFRTSCRSRNSDLSGLVWNIVSPTSAMRLLIPLGAARTGSDHSAASPTPWSYRESIQRGFRRGHAGSKGRQWCAEHVNSRFFLYFPINVTLFSLLTEEKNYDADVALFYIVSIMN